MSRLVIYIVDQDREIDSDLGLMPSPGTRGSHILSPFRNALAAVEALRMLIAKIERESISEYIETTSRD